MRLSNALKLLLGFRSKFELPGRSPERVPRHYSDHILKDLGVCRDQVTPVRDPRRPDPFRISQIDNWRKMS